MKVNGNPVKRNGTSPIGRTTPARFANAKKIKKIVTHKVNTLLKRAIYYLMYQSVFGNIAVSIAAAFSFRGL